MRNAWCVRSASCVMSDVCCTVLMWVMGDTMRVGMGVMYLQGEVVMMMMSNYNVILQDD